MTTKPLKRACNFKVRLEDLVATGKQLLAEPVYGRKQYHNEKAYQYKKHCLPIKTSSPSPILY
jgi:hypothetical protein